MTTRKVISATLLLASLAALPAHAQQTAPAAPPAQAPAQALPSLDPHAGETKAQRDRRMKWFREARFGMFIHWGLYAVPAGEWNGQPIGGIGEWIMNRAKIPVADYAALAPRFNPTRFDAEQWAQLAQDAGMKYLVITAKHHEGFAMFPSRASTFNISDATPFKRDPLAELDAACRKRGIKFGLYYSQAQDWHQPGGAAYGNHWDKAQDGDLHAYVQKIAAPQVSEILSRYKPVVLWWDTPVDMSREDIVALTAGFAQNPQLIANNRLGNGVKGDTETPEQFVPAQGFPGRDWETCMTINDTWGFKKDDTNFKSAESLTRNLIDIASKGGNYLLNVGPDASGVIPAPEAERLRAVGAWLRRNGASIYATTPSPYKRLPFEGRATVKGNTLFLNVFKWPEGGLTLGGLHTQIRGVRVVATGEKLRVLAYDTALSLSRPAKLDDISTTIALDLAGPPVVTEPEMLIAPQPDGAFRLGALEATLQGEGIKTEGGDKGNIGYWTSAADSVSWKIAAPAAGKYLVSLEYACEPGSENSTFSIEVDGKDAGLRGSVPATASWSDYKTLTLDGTLALEAGRHTLRLKPIAKPGLAVMNLRAISLQPAAR